MLVLVLMIFACLCFLVAAFWQPPPPRVNLVALGLAAWILSTLVQIHR